MNPLKNIYLMGICGTGMGAFAGLLKRAGYQVSGSDSNMYPPMSDKLAEWNIEVKTPFAAENLHPKPDLVVVGNVIRRDNVEALAAHELKLPQKSFPEALREMFLQHSEPMVVTGTHGKTTCSSLLAHTLTHAGYEPNFLIGGIPLNFGESFACNTSPFTKGGQGDLRFLSTHKKKIPLNPPLIKGEISDDNRRPFIVEGDEYDTAYWDKGPKFLHYMPKHLLCTSLEFDHADIYANIEQIKDRFSELFNIVSNDGNIVVCSDAPHLLEALHNANPQAKITSYGSQGDYQAKNVDYASHGTFFDVYVHDVCEGRLSIPLFGNHNLENALGCYALLHKKGLTHEQIADGFASFKGVKRRMEVVGEKNGIVVIDDFAHHPTAVQKTIEAVAQKYPTKKIWALFEPRSASSCRNIFQNDFAKSFAGAHKVMLAPLGRKMEKDMLNVHQLADDIAAKNGDAKAYESIEDMVAMIARDAEPETVLLCMSNGSFSGIHSRILHCF